MAKPILPLKRLSFDRAQGKVGATVSKSGQTGLLRVSCAQGGRISS
jgi:hypothetical protein